MFIESPLLLVVIAIVAATAVAFRLWIALAVRGARRRTDALLGRAERAR